MQDSGTAIRNAAAQVREILIAEAAKRAGVPADQLHAEDGAVRRRRTARGFGYGELVVRHAAACRGAARRRS